MRVKVIGVTDKNEEKRTSGHGAIGQVGEAVFRADNRFLLMPEGNDGGLLTSTVEKISVETRNSVYELEVVR
jgi:hypothetical protein